MLLNYSLTAGAVFLASNISEASISGQAINQVLHNSTYNFNFGAGEGNKLSISNSTPVYNYGYIAHLTANAGWIQVNGSPFLPYHPPRALNNGSMVSAGKNFFVPPNNNNDRIIRIDSYGGAHTCDPAFQGATKYIGVKFNLIDGTHYGWIKVTMPNDLSFVQIDSCAYNTVVNAPIHGTLPVELNAFTANNNNGKITLNWQTATEVNNFGFDIERSQQRDLKNGGPGNPDLWEKIGFVNGYGNSNSQRQYSFVDKSAPNGLAMYRLKQVDNDGTFAYSNILTVDNTVPAKFNLSQNYPNPFNPVTNINFSIPESGEVTLKVYNSLGEAVAVLINKNMDVGNYSVEFNASELPSGVYVYKLEVNGKFQSQKKMNLIK